MEQRFHFLRLFARIYVALGVLLIVAGGVAIFIGLLGDAHDKFAHSIMTTTGLIICISLAISGLAIASYGQFLQVVMQIEENTRN